MTHIMGSTSKVISNKVRAKANFRHNLDDKLGNFFLEHPYVTYIATAIALPILILLAIGILTTAIMLPISLIFGLI